MTPRQLDAMQWFGFLAAPFAWATQLVLGYYVADAHCEAARLTSGWSPAELTLTATAALIALAAEAAAVAVFLEVGRVNRDAPGPPGRQRLLAFGALVGNVLFLVAILLGGVAVVATRACRPA